MKADFSKGFKIESEDGTTGSTRIYDSTGVTVGMVEHFELVLDSKDSLPRITLKFPTGTESLLPLTPEELQGLAFTK
jgi:hypothetical protein